MSRKVQAQYVSALLTVQQLAGWYEFEIVNDPMYCDDDTTKINPNFIRWCGKKLFQVSTNRNGLYKTRDCETSIELIYNINSSEIDFTIKLRTVNWDFIRVTIDPKCYGLAKQVENIFRSLQWHGEIAVNRMIRDFERDYDEKNKKDSEVSA